MLLELRNLVDLRAFIHTVKKSGKTIGFVPTMGFLHAGHMSLVRMSKSKADVTIASIYVNPSQFNENTDFDSYPRDEKSDLLLLQQNFCDAVFIPKIDEMETLSKVHVDLGGLESVMEGKFRPGHFKGVIEVVYRLFSVVTPNYAYLGEKDFQQIMVIQKMVNHLKLCVQIVPAPIVRESNGLAMSSRNSKLSSIGREKASVVFEVLRNYLSEDVRFLEQKLLSSGFELEYLEEHEIDGCKRLFIAGFLEGVRLIDNIQMS